MKQWLKDLSWWWKYDCDWFNFYRCRRVKRYIKRIWAWNKFLWKKEIEEWDHYYLCMIFAFALRRQANHIESVARHVGYEKDVKKMRVAAALIERYGKDDYAEPMLSEIAEEFAWFEDWTHDWIKTEVHPDFGQLSRRVDRRPEEMVEREKRTMARLRKHEEERRKADIELFCDILKKNLTRWWE